MGPVDTMDFLLRSRSGLIELRTLILEGLDLWIVSAQGWDSWTRQVSVALAFLSM